MAETGFISPFDIYLSSDAELFIFSDSWDHTRHYAAVFNAQAELLQPWHHSGKRWAMIADWRTLLVQVPASERLCVLGLKDFVQRGLAYYVPVTHEHVLAKWQTQQVAQQVAELSFKIMQDFDSAKAELSKQGFDTNFKAIPFKQAWLKPSADFADIVTRLGQDPKRFGVVA